MVMRRKNHFIDYLIAGVSGEKSDVLIRPAMTPDVLPEVFNSPPNQRIISTSSAFELPPSVGASTTNELSEKEGDDGQETHKKIQASSDGAHDANSNNIGAMEDQQKISKKSTANNDAIVLKEQAQGWHIVNEDNNNNNTSKGKPDLYDPDIAKPNTKKMIEKKVGYETSKVAGADDNDSLVGAIISSSSGSGDNTDHKKPPPLGKIKDRQMKNKDKESSSSLLSSSHEKQAFSTRVNSRQEEPSTINKDIITFPSENTSRTEALKHQSSTTVIPDKFSKRGEGGLLSHSTSSFKKTHSPSHGNGGRTSLYHSEPSVTINIGRIEIRAISSQQKQQQQLQQSSTKMMFKQQKEQQHFLSLKEYLKQRSEGRYDQRAP